MSTTLPNSTVYEYPCSICGQPTSHVNPPKRGGDPGQTRYNLCRECGGVPPNAR